MNDYMLIYKGGDPKWMENTSKVEMAASMEQWGAWMGMLEQKEQLVSGGSPLSYTGNSISQDGVVTDLSSIELKELVSGYSIIKATDIDEATAIAKECPIFNYPDITVEVRAVMCMD
ncbi:MAG: hypothetical protein HRU38_01595 [Saccharospirillaceae bacterium]|nr:hypothetical protein [Colwellia sp.]NRB77354.1 hypothetical protein [Saccharospirillaceae bacterium]